MSAITVTKSEKLTVLIRVRPPILREVKEQNAVSVSNNRTVHLQSDKQEIKCNYDHVFNEVSEQSDVFNYVQPLLNDVLSGINSCIFAYGQTSAGKSYTMVGPNGGQNILKCTRDLWGLLPRTAEYLLGILNEKAADGQLIFSVKASFLQIYNENLYDLLRDSGPMIEDKLILSERDSEYELKIREVIPHKNKSRGSTFKNNGSINQSVNEVYVAGLSEFRVQTSSDIMRILAVGTNNRMTRSTDYNATSSRSHAILQLTFDIQQQEEGQTIIYRSKLNLVDLAGSEKNSTSTQVLENNPKHMKELTSINKSLSSLGNVIAALSSGNRSHIPYRDSKLTRILQDSLSGNTRTILIACIAPTILHAAETLSTLQFADRAKSVMLTVKANSIVDDKQVLIRAENEISRLKSLLTHALKQKETPNEDMLRRANGMSDIDISNIIKENENLKKEIKALKLILKSKAATEQHNNELQIPGYLSNNSSLPSLRRSVSASKSNNNRKNNNHNNYLLDSYNINSPSKKLKNNDNFYDNSDDNNDYYNGNNSRSNISESIKSARMSNGEYGIGNKQKSYKNNNNNNNNMNDPTKSNEIFSNFLNRYRNNSVNPESENRVDLNHNNQ
eukprot:gene9086-12254_t